MATMRLPSVASRSCRDENRRGSNKRNSRARVISSRSNKVRFNTPGNIVVAEGWDRQEADALAEDPALVPQLLEWDVVEYSKPAAGDAAVHRLGRVVHISESSCLVEPMVQKSSGLWMLDAAFEEPEAVSNGNIVRVIDAYYSQRAVEDRISNPHGEHAEEVWEVTGLGDISGSMCQSH